MWSAVTWSPNTSGTGPSEAPVRQALCCIFARWHAEHHRRPAALLGTPTLVSFLLFAALVFLPVLLLSSVAAACAFTLGTVLGYLGYATTHHAVHHWHGPSLWLSKRKRWHALHHSRPKDAVCFGVTSPGWDRLLGTAPHGRPAHPHPATRP
jgi:cyclopropane-fatty-acyl-phospholipid synthase